MASILNTPTTNAGTKLDADLIKKLVLGATTITRGLMRMVPNAQDKVELSTFATALDLLEARDATPTTPNDGMSKGKIIITTTDMMFYDTFNPITDFENDFPAFWHTGKMTDAQLNAKIRSAVIETTAESVANGVEKLLWQGDSLSGDAWLTLMDGFEKKLTAAVAVVNNVTDLTVAIDKTNILAVLQGLIDVTPSPVLEKGNPTFVMSHRMKQIYFEASRDITISKGINIFEGGTPRFAGYPIVSTGISENKALFINASTGRDANLAGATWMNADMTGAKIMPLQNNSEVWFVKYLFRLGVNLVLPEQISYYDGTVA